MKKRIAIQLFGHLRTFQETYKSLFDKVIYPNQEDGYEVDIFIHTWIEKEHSDVNFSNPKGELIREKSLSEEEKESILKLYSPKKYFLDKQENINEEIFLDRAGNKRSTKTFCNLSKTIFASNNLRKGYEKEKNITYDWVIVTRPDILFLEDLKISNFLKTYRDWRVPVNKKTVFYSCSSQDWNENWYSVAIPELITCNDLIFFGKPEAINIATSAYLKWYKLIDKEKIITFEKIIRDYWLEKNIIPIAIKYRMGEEFIIKRLPYISSKVNLKTRVVEKLLGFTLGCIKILPYYLAEPLLKKEGPMFRFLRKTRYLLSLK